MIAASVQELSLTIPVNTSSCNTHHSRRQITVATVAGKERRNGDGTPVIERHRCIPR